MSEVEGWTGREMSLESLQTLNDEALRLEAELNIKAAQLEAVKSKMSSTSSSAGSRRHHGMPVVPVSAKEQTARALWRDGQRHEGGILLYEHKFREDSPKKPHEKERCPSCGVWKDKCGECYLCVQMRKRFGLQGGDWSSPYHSASKYSYANHKFRDEVKWELGAKVKCASCGCWVARGAPCRLCKRVA